MGAEIKPSINVYDQESFAIGLIEKYKIKTVEGSKPDKDEVWVYYDGFYHTNGFNKVNKDVLSNSIVKKIFDKDGNEVLDENGEVKTVRLPYEDHDYVQILSFIRARTRNYKREDLLQKPYTCNISNGILYYGNDVVEFISRYDEQGNEKEFSDYNFTYKLPLVYNPIAECPEIDGIIEEILIDRDCNIDISEEKKEESEEEQLEKFWEQQEQEEQNLLFPDEVKPETSDYNRDKIKIFHELLGHMLMTSEYYVKKAVIMVGDNHCGKTATLNITRQFIDNNASSIQLNDLDRKENRFMGEGLRGKLANIADEMPSISSKNFNIFMAATGDGIFPIEGKGKDPSELHNIAKFLNTANDLPKLDSNIKNRVYDRLVIIEFNNVFATGAKDTNPKLKTKKYSTEEMSGLLNHAIEGMNRLLKNGMFTYDNDFTPTLYENHLKRENYIENFIMNRYEITQSKEHILSIEFIYKDYKIWCIKNAIKPVGMNFFSSELSKIDAIKIKRLTDKIKYQITGKQIRLKFVIGIKVYTPSDNSDMKIILPNTKSKEPVKTTCSVCGKDMQNFNSELSEFVTCQSCESNKVRKPTSLFDNEEKITLPINL